MNRFREDEPSNQEILKFNLEDCYVNNMNQQGKYTQLSTLKESSKVSYKKYQKQKSTEQIIFKEQKLFSQNKIREIKDFDDQRKVLELDPFFNKLLNEIVIHKKLSIAEVCFIPLLDQFVNSRGNFVLVFQQIEGKTLESVMKDHLNKNKSFKDEWIKNVISQISICMLFMQEFNIVHRNITPKNIIITEYGTLKLGKFRDAFIDEGSTIDKSYNADNFYYWPPEALNGSFWSLKADCWFLGHIIQELVVQENLLVKESTTMREVNDQISVMTIANVNLSADQQFVLKNLLNIKAPMRFDAKLLVNKVDYIQKYVKSKCSNTVNCLKFINMITEFDQLFENFSETISENRNQFQQNAKIEKSNRGDVDTMKKMVDKKKSELEIQSSKIDKYSFDLYNKLVELRNQRKQSKNQLINSNVNLEHYGKNPVTVEYFQIIRLPKMYDSQDFISLNKKIEDGKHIIRIKMLHFNNFICLQKNDTDEDKLLNFSQLRNNCLLFGLDYQFNFEYAIDDDNDPWTTNDNVTLEIDVQESKFKIYNNTRDIILGSTNLRIIEGTEQKLGFFLMNLASKLKILDQQYKNDYEVQNEDMMSIPSDLTLYKD